METIIDLGNVRRKRPGLVQVFVLMAPFNGPKPESAAIELRFVHSIVPKELFHFR